MPLNKKFYKHSKKSAKRASKPSALITSKFETDPIRLTKKLAIEEGAIAVRGNLKASKSFKWHKDERKPERPKIEHLLQGLVEKSDLEKVIDEIESKGSSSEPEELEDEKEDTEPELDLSMTEDKKILDFDISSIEMSSSVEEIDNELHVKVESEINFLDAFGKVPEMDELSLDLLEEKEGTKTQQHEKKELLITKPSTVADLGKFLDPVTGLPDLDLDATWSSPPKEILFDEESLNGYIDNRENEEQMQSQGLSVTDDLSGDESEKSTDEFEPVGAALQDQDNTFDLFLEGIEPEKLEISEEDIEDKEMLKLAQQKQLVIENTVTEFLNKLIDRCITQAEFNESDVVLRRSLDKYKLVCELKRIYDLLVFERTKSEFLNKKTVLFFKRKGTFRPITPELASTLASNQAGFLTSLNILDEWLSREEKTKVFNSNKISALQQEFEVKKQECFETLSKLEHLIRTTFQRKNFDKLQNYVKKVIQKMSVVRSEISEVRIKLLLQQHQFSSLQMKLERLEDLGNGLNIRQYESLQTETLAVSKKIEENNNTLQKLHRHLHDDLHKIAHVKEKESILKNIAVAQKQFLEELVDKEKTLRKDVHRLKLQRNQLKHEKDKLMHQAGLLSNQILLRDYDRTVEKANNLRQTNSDLKQIIEELNSNIEKLAFNIEKKV